MSINRDAKIEINLSELVSIRSSFLGEDMTESQVEEVAYDLRLNLTFDTIFGMVDDSILKYFDKLETHYGEIQPEPGREALLTQIEKNKKQFEIVDLKGPSWTIKVPRRIHKK